MDEEPNSTPFDWTGQVFIIQTTFKVDNLKYIYVDGTNNSKLSTCELFPLKTSFKKSSSNSITAASS